MFFGLIMFLCLSYTRSFTFSVCDNTIVLKLTAFSLQVVDRKKK